MFITLFALQRFHIDYTIDSGIIVFNNIGNYFITMSNNAIETYMGMPGAYDPDEMRIKIIVTKSSNSKELQVTNYELQIMSYKLQVRNIHYQITN